MKPITFRSIAVLLGLCLGTGAAALAAEVRAPLPGHGTLVFDLPEGWQADVGNPAFGPTYAARFTRADRPQFRMSLSMAWFAEGKMPEREGLLKALRAEADRGAKIAVDGTIKLVEPAADGPQIGHVSLDLQRPVVGAPKHRIVGFGFIDEVTLTLNGTWGDGDDELAGQTVAMLRTARHESAGPPAAGRVPAEGRLVVTPKEDFTELSVPASRVVLRVPTARWPAAPTFGPGNHPRYFLFGAKDRTVTMSGWIETSARFSSLQDMAGDTPAAPQVRDKRFGQVGAWETMSYVHDLDRLGQQTYLRAHRREAGTWVELRLSTLGTQPQEEALEALTAALQSIQFELRP